MEAVAYSNVRNHLKEYLHKVNENSDVVYITTRDNTEDAVLLSKTDYENLLENAYIRNSQANVDFIMKSWEEAKAGMAKEHSWE